MPDDNRPAIDAHLKQWLELGQRIRAQMGPILQIGETFRKSIQPIVEAQEQLQKALEPIISSQRRWHKMLESIRLPQITLPDFSPIAQQVLEFQEAIQWSIGPAFLEFQKAFHELPARTQEALLTLGRHGWYLDPEMSLPDLWEFKKALGEGNVTEAESALVQHFEIRLSEIEESITNKFPHRAHLVRAAFAAHRREEYELSIPVLFAQADGICKDTINQYLFIRQDKKPSTAIYVGEIAANTYMAAFLSPLAENLPVSASEKERSEGFAALNRHMVVHGESLDYGNKVNGLRAISLVNYVASVLPIDSP